MSKIETFFGRAIENVVISLFGEAKRTVKNKYIPEFGDRVRFVGTHWKYGESAYYGFEGVVDQAHKEYISINSGSSVLICTDLTSSHCRFQRIEDQ